MHCPICRNARLVRITMHVNERQLALHSCSHCESRWWESDGSQVGLDRVLAQAARSPQ